MNMSGESMRGQGVTALIADDEPHLRAALRRRLGEVWPELEVVAEAQNGIEALDRAADVEPDIAFLDIRMPGLDGMEVARRLTGRCHLVFVTAYDDYAVSAFEHDAVDYLVKPVTHERLERTVSRLRQRLERESPQALDALFDELSLRLGRPPAPALKWLRCGVRDRVRMVAVETVCYFVSADKYTTVVTADGEMVIRKSLKELEAELDPQQFWRIHRGVIVNLAFVEGCYRDEEGRLLLELQGLSTTLQVSRNYSHRFRQM